MQEITEYAPDRSIKSIKLIKSNQVGLLAGLRKHGQGAWPGWTFGLFSEVNQFESRLLT